MKKNLLKVTALGLVALTLTGCGPKLDKEVGTNLYNDLAKGFKAIGEINVNTEYFEDSDYITPTDKIENESKKMEAILTFTNTDKYEGFDYKLNEVKLDGTKKYLASDNLFNDNNHLAFNAVNYENKFEVSYAQDDDANLVPYGTNGTINPFTLLNANDFSLKHGHHSLKNEDATLFAFTLASNIEFIPSNLNIASNSFDFMDGTLKAFRMESNPYYSVKTFKEEGKFINYYAKNIYSFNFNVSEVGVANSKNELKLENDKKENDPLKEAIAHLNAQTNYRVSRHFTTDVAPEEETVDCYIDGTNKSLYMAVYDHRYGRPQEATESDALFVDSPKDEDVNLNAYMYQLNNAETGEMKFKWAKELRDIDNVLPYEAFKLNNLGLISEDIFNINEDGSYSPIPTHLKYIGADIFIPPLCVTNEIAGGYVTDFKLYLTKDQKDIDKIVLNSTLGTYNAVITITYDQIGTSTIPFDALNNIVE